MNIMFEYSLNRYGIIPSKLCGIYVINTKLMHNALRFYMHFKIIWSMVYLTFLHSLILAFFRTPFVLVDIPASLRPAFLSLSLIFLHPNSEYFLLIFS